MCGIAGVYRFADGSPIQLDQLKTLFLQIEHRGGDATGIALLQANGEVVVHKDDNIAWRYIESRGFEKFIEAQLKADTVAALLHTRAATQGNPRFNKNNHPLHSGKAAIVHNGCIQNDNTLFTNLKLERGAETDSDIIRAIVDKDGITKNTIKTLNKLSGSAAIAAIHPEYPGKMLLGRSGSPLVVAMVDNNLMWASEKDAIHAAARPWQKWRGIWLQPTRVDILMTPMENDSMWLIGPEGLEFHDKFNPCFAYTRPTYRTYENFADKQQRFNADAADKSTDKPYIVAAPISWHEGGQQMFMCRNTGCRKTMHLPDELKKEPLHTLQCRGCKTTLAPIPN